MELGLGMTVIMTMMMAMVAAMVDLSIRSISHGSRIEEFVAVKARETASVVNMLPT